MKTLVIPNRIHDNLGKADSQAGFYDLFILYLYLTETGKHQGLGKADNQAGFYDLCNLHSVSVPYTAGKH